MMYKIYFIKEDLWDCLTQMYVYVKFKRATNWPRSIYNSNRHNLFYILFKRNWTEKLIENCSD